MINSLKNMLAQVMYTPTVNPKTNSDVSSLGYNPFEKNPFIQSPQRNNYAVNRPVKGGYFAGYYNGKQNIVGRRLFIEA